MFDGLAVVEAACGLDRAERRWHVAACRNPLHPGPCKGWKNNGVPGDTPAKTPEAVKKAAKKAVKKTAKTGPVSLDQKIAKPKAVPVEPGSKPKKAPAPAKAPAAKAPAKAPVKAPAGDTGTQKPGGKPGRKLTRKTATAMQEQMTAQDPWAEQQQISIKEYSEDEYVYMNAKMRGVTPRAFDQNLTDPDPDATDRRIKNVNASLRPLPVAVQVTRLTDPEGLGLSKSYTRGERLASLRTLVGKRTQEKGFLSTSIKPLSQKALSTSGIKTGVRLDITLPEGFRAAYIRSVSANPDEDEILGQPGSIIDWTELDESEDPPVLRGVAVLDEQ